MLNSENKKYIILLLALVVVAGILYSGHLLPSQPDKNADLFYSYEVEDNDIEKFNIAKLNTSINKPDDNIKTLTGNHRILTNRTSDLILLKQTLTEENENLESITGYKLKLLDTNKKNIKVIDEFDEETLISDAFIFPDKNKIGYITRKSQLNNDEDHSGILHIYDQTKSTTTEISIDAEPVMYGGYKVKGFNEDTNIIYLASTGGDAGSLWGENYTLNIETKELEEAGSFSSSRSGFNFVRNKNGNQWGNINPEGSLSAYVEFSQKGDEFEESHFSEERRRKCLTYQNRNNYGEEGDVIILKDINSSEEKEIYRNLDFEDNLCKLSGRDITNLIWKDNNHIVFSTLLSVYEIEINKESLTRSQVEELYRFPELHSSPAERQQPHVIRVSGNYIALSDGSVVNQKTGKRLTLRNGAFIGQ